MQKNLQKLLDQKTVLLFFQEYEADKFVKYDRYIKRILRPLYHKLHRRQKKSGFAVWLDLLRRALLKSGYDVRINDYRTAKRNPEYPVGAVGYPTLLENWKLPNPAILGPALYDHPGLKPDLFKDSHFKKFAVVAPWVMDMFRPVYGDKCFSWFAGIDLDEWPDRSSEPKTYDFLIYDKIRWKHDELQNSMIEPIQHMLSSKGLTHRLVRYRLYDHATYKNMLSSSRAMIFLCEHETQGMAYQEAMASGVPILAWDNGFWADPLWKKYTASAPPASSVPFFSPDCGEKFRDMSEFGPALDRFMSKRATYNPRKYVAENLSMEKSARLYAEQYFGLLNG